MDGDGETMATRDEIEREAEENRKEALLASTPSLQPNFNRSNLTQKQISKLQIFDRLSLTDSPELHKRRMQIKANSKIHKKPKASKNSQSRAVQDGENSQKSKESTSTSSVEQHHHKTVVTAPTKPQKLFWGLDTRERWERKANM